MGGEGGGDYKNWFGLAKNERMLPTTLNKIVGRGGKKREEEGRGGKRREEEGRNFFRNLIFFY